MRPSGRRAEHGFTLAELIIAILVTGILAVVAIPRFAGISDYEVQGTFDRALVTVRYAQKVAIASRVPVRVTFSGNAVSACYAGGGACTSQVTDPVRSAALQAEGSADVTITGTSFTFDGLGRPDTGPVTVTVSGGGLAKTFVVEAETGMHIRERQHGLSLVELILFVVIVGAGLAGVLRVLDLTAAKSADPVVRKQLLAVAESLLEEISRMPFTYCDPDDAAAATATSEAGCTVAESVTSPGPETAQGESRYSTTTPFDNVNDYHGFSMSGIRDLTGTAVAGLGGYSVSVTVTAGGLEATNAGDVALVAVTATGPGNESVTLHGYRTRHAPNAIHESAARSGRGFTLVELMITVTIAGIVFASVALFIQRPVQGYLDANRRAELSDTADAALRRILRDLRLALPNSVRVDTSGRYLEFLQVSGGGRYRAAPAAGGSGDPLDFENPAGDVSFDVVGTAPAVTASQFVVVFNLGTGFTGADAYQATGNNRAAIAGATGSTITLAAAKAFPHASPGKRFHVVDHAVTYECNPTEGVIRRYWNYGIAATQATPPSGGSHALLATRVSDCAFTYNANELLQRYGTVSLRIALAAEGETLTLHGQAHVSNVP